MIQPLMKISNGFLALASLSLVMAACGTDSPPPAAISTPSGIASTGAGGALTKEEVCTTVKTHEVTYFRELIDAALLKQDAATNAAYAKHSAAIKALVGRIDSDSLAEGIDEYVTALQETANTGESSLIGRAKIVLSCGGPRADFEPFHGITDPAVATNIEATCKEFNEKARPNDDIFSIAFANIRYATGAEAQAEVVKAKKAATEWAATATKLSGTTTDPDLKAALKLQGSMVSAAAATLKDPDDLGITSEAMALVVTEHFDATGEVILRYCGKS